MTRAQNITVFVAKILIVLTSKTHKFFNMHPFPVRPPPSERGDAGGSIGGSLAENGCISKNLCAFKVVIVNFLLTSFATIRAQFSVHNLALSPPTLASPSHQAPLLATMCNVPSLYLTKKLQSAPLKDAEVLQYASVSGENTAKRKKRCWRFDWRQSRRKRMRIEELVRV